MLANGFDQVAVEEATRPELMRKNRMDKGLVGM
jgi:hypothetical protein